METFTYRTFIGKDEDIVNDRRTTDAPPLPRSLLPGLEPDLLCQARTTEPPHCVIELITSPARAVCG
ncbi:hypothetical protein J6590_091948 [Homalodisca vitripennis]|nr:hypothetical protein J6590_091948 [Homalodisca vitripennis]